MLTEPTPPLFTEESRLTLGSVTVVLACLEPKGVGTPELCFVTSLTLIRPSRETDLDYWPPLLDEPAT